jgi:hypothetical protein
MGRITELPIPALYRYVDSCPNSDRKAELDIGRDWEDWS